MRQHKPLRNEAHIDDDRVRRFAEHHRRERARVEAFKRADARVGRKARIELSMADIDGDDLRRAARKQDVGEASGRGADVEADEACRIEREGVERGGKLDSAARGPGVGRLGFDRRVTRNLFRGLLKRDPADADEPRRNRGLSAGATRKEAALDENDIRTLAHGAFNEPREAHCQWKSRCDRARMSASAERSSDELRLVTRLCARVALRPVAMIPIPYALDALNFLAADVRNLFGPFVNVFLVTDQHWSQTDVGLVTTASGLLGIAFQTPIGAAIDVTRAKRGVIVLTMAAMTLAAAHYLCRSHFLADGDRLERAGGRGRRVRSGSLGADPWPRDKRQARAASRPQLGVRSWREHRDCASGRRELATRFSQRAVFLMVPVFAVLTCAAVARHSSESDQS